MRPIILLLLTLLSFYQSIGTSVVAELSTPLWPPELYSSLIPQKLLATTNTQRNPPQYPQYTDRVVGEWQWFSPDTWSSGFLPATMYELHTRTRLCTGQGSGEGTDWVDLGRVWSAAEVPLETKTSVGHDVGFLSFPFVQELLVNPYNKTAINAVNTFAADLAARFSPIVGCTRSWDSSDPTLFEVIIDNMMTIDVLFSSYSLTRNSTLIDIAKSHANKTMLNHVRPDGSSFHLVEYNATTGEVIARATVQGYSDNSTWSRGQAWGLYGFANMYSYTNDMNYLETSRKMANYFLDHLPSDGVVPWDFNAPDGPSRPADTSAATIASTGLLLLARQELSLSPPSLANAARWVAGAWKLLNATTDLAWKPSWQSLLSNGTVNNPAANNDTGIVYGDYYYIKAGNDLVEMGLTQC
ncbi:glycoside hydrolase family 88 protein [Paxillus rubicundulus Ve08.2h10]|uniref:Glycoside hydrolase family 88 protein n=1 Tax=Paxillus rubicundulus Ve08.2h10 TaxID=930991 RepID=A0A0D0DRZ8_9AGAM|nr:glycoside hydrolase family 88 protein [Paxillus rubicundulus Ve08.2h10]